MTEKLFEADSYARTATGIIRSITEDGVELNQTIFYACSGGQPGDIGYLVLPDGDRLRVIDTRIDREKRTIRHVLEAYPATLTVGVEVQQEIDWSHRYRHMQMHTALHLLSSLVAGGVNGCQIGANKSRIDFVPDDPESLDKDRLSHDINELIKRDAMVNISSITDAELDAQPDLVRTMSVQPPRGLGSIRLVKIDDIDLQPCGGTHVRQTSEITPITITKIENKGKGARRISLEFA